MELSLNNRKLTLPGIGISIGAILAALLSWTVNHSILFSVVHFFCSWIYVIYYVLVHTNILG